MATSSTEQPTAITTPTDLATAFKHSGSFDSLRRSLLDDFLASPDKDLFLTQLDALLPSLLSKPSFKRHAKRERQAELMAGVEREGVLLRQLDESVGNKLREGEGGVEEALRGLLRSSRGEGEETVQEKDLVQQQQQQQTPSSTFIPADPTLVTTTTDDSPPTADASLPASHAAPIFIHEPSSAPPPPTEAEPVVMAMEQDLPTTVDISLAPPAVPASTAPTSTSLQPPSLTKPTPLLAPPASAPFSAPTPSLETAVSTTTTEGGAAEGAALDALMEPLVASLGGGSQGGGATSTTALEAAGAGDKLEEEEVASALLAGAAEDEVVGVAEEVGMDVDAEGEVDGGVQAPVVAAVRTEEEVKMQE